MKKKKVQNPMMPIVIMLGLFILIGAVMIFFGLRGTWQLEHRYRRITPDLPEKVLNDILSLRHT